MRIIFESHRFKNLWEPAQLKPDCIVFFQRSETLKGFLSLKFWFFYNWRTWQVLQNSPKNQNRWFSQKWEPPDIGIYLPHTSLNSVLDLILGWYENHKKHPIPGAGWCVQKLITGWHLSLMYTREYILLSSFFSLLKKNSFWVWGYSKDLISSHKNKTNFQVIVCILTELQTLWNSTSQGKFSTFHESEENCGGASASQSLFVFTQEQN